MRSHLHSANSLKTRRIFPELQDYSCLCHASSNRREWCERYDTSRRPPRRKTYRGVRPLRWDDLFIRLQGNRSFMTTWCRLRSWKARGRF